MKRKLFVTLMSLFVIGMFVIMIVQKDQNYSSSERRKLAALPEINFDTISSGKFMNEFEDYTLDQFPFRDTFRSIKAYIQNDLFLKKDNNKYVYTHDHLTKLEYPYVPSNIDYAAKKFNTIYEKYLMDQDIDPYLAIVPDKNYYLLDDSYVSLDYSTLVNDLTNQLDFHYIDLFPLLTIDDYYLTDTHWHQNRIQKVADQIANEMGYTLSSKYQEVSVNDPFYGVYYGQSALHVKTDSITYLTNDMLENCVVENLEKNKVGKVYDLDKLESNDPYEVFLSGAVSLLHIENPQVNNGKKLVLFRDSFGSSLAPLLFENYEEIYMVDIRYIQSDLVGQFVDFENADVLFIYSTLVLNNALSLK